MAAGLSVVTLRCGGPSHRGRRVPGRTAITLTLGATILEALRRATRRAAFETPVAFERP